MRNFAKERIDVLEPDAPSRAYKALIKWHQQNGWWWIWTDGYLCRLADGRGHLHLHLDQYTLRICLRYAADFICGNPLTRAHNILNLSTEVFGRLNPNDFVQPKIKIVGDVPEQNIPPEPLPEPEPYQTPVTVIDGDVLF